MSRITKKFKNTPYMSGGKVGKFRIGVFIPNILWKIPPVRV